jgi:hypothetical protein
MSEKSFRPRACDLVEFLKSAGWALHGQMKSIRKHWPTYREYLPEASSWPTSA